MFLSSRQFQKWLALATQCTIHGYTLLGRRFHKGLDYSVATDHDGEPILEISLGLTPTAGWGGNNKAEEANESEKQKEEEPKEDDVRGYEVYMAGDDEEDNGNAECDNVLLMMLASWNKMSIVLRDSGVSKFVKHIGVHFDEEKMAIGEESSDEEMFNGLLDSGDSDSD